MKLMDHVILVEIDSDEYLLVNSLNGRVDIVNSAAYNIIMNWRKCEEIVAGKAEEVSLFNFLHERGHLTRSKSDENEKKSSIVNTLLDKYKSAKHNVNHLIFVMTYGCNFRCSYCFENGVNEKREVLKPYHIDAALNLAGESLKYVGLFGGEPLMPETHDSVQYLFKKVPDKIFDITTNGYYLFEYAEILSTVNLSFVNVTIDGDENYHNSKRFLADSSSTFAKIISGIEKCLQLNIPVRIRMNLNNENIESCMRTQDELLDSFSEYHDILEFDATPLFNLDDENRNHLIYETYKSYFKCNEGEHSKSKHFPTLSPVISSVLTGVPMVPVVSYCYAHENNLIVDPYGDLYSCLVSVGRKELKIGEYYPAVKFKNNSIYNRNIGVIDKCRDCEYSLLCGGGCPMRLKDYGDVFKPVCSVVKNHVHEMLPLLYKLKREVC